MAELRRRDCHLTVGRRRPRYSGGDRGSRVRTSRCFRKKNVSDRCNHPLALRLVEWQTFPRDRRHLQCRYIEAAKSLGKIVTERLLAILTRGRMFSVFRGATALFAW